MRFPARSAALLLLSVLATGCSAFRMEVGAGTGVGVSVKVPYFYNGGLLTPSVEQRMGHNYAEGWHAGHNGEPAALRADKDYDCAIVLGAAEARTKVWGAAVRGWTDPFANDETRTDIEGAMRTFSLFPIGWTAEQPSTHALELNLHLFVSIHLGWNPYFWYTKPEERVRTIRYGFLPPDEPRAAPKSPPARGD